jgi:hypothetical protein
LSECADDGELIAEVSVESLEVLRHFDDGIPVVIGNYSAVVDVLHVRRFNEGVIEVLVFRIDWMIYLERAASFREIARYIDIAYKMACIAVDGAEFAQSSHGKDTEAALRPAANTLTAGGNHSMTAESAGVEIGDVAANRINAVASNTAATVATRGTHALAAVNTFAGNGPHAIAALPFKTSATNRVHAVTASTTPRATMGQDAVTASAADTGTASREYPKASNANAAKTATRTYSFAARAKLAAGAASMHSDPAAAADAGILNKESATSLSCWSDQTQRDRDPKRRAASAVAP